MGELLIYILLNSTVQSISTKMYYIISTKVLQGSDTVCGTVLQKRCSRIYGLNSRLVCIQRVSKNSFLKLNFLEYIVKDLDHNYYNNSLKYLGNRRLFL